MTRSDMARALGRQGGNARNARLSTAEKRRIAAMGAQARRRSLLAARRIADTLRYAAALDELSGRAPVRRRRTCAGPLPGIYATTTRRT